MKYIVQKIQDSSNVALASTDTPSVVTKPQSSNHRLDNLGPVDNSNLANIQTQGSEYDISFHDESIGGASRWGGC